jgi:hypothetical protein
LWAPEEKESRLEGQAAPVWAHKKAEHQMPGFESLRKLLANCL